MFALLAVAGDMGGAFGPSMVGYFSQQAGDNLQVGLLTGCTFPLIMLAALIAMRKMAKMIDTAVTLRQYHHSRKHHITDSGNPEKS